MIAIAKSSQQRQTEKTTTFFGLKFHNSKDADIIQWLLIQPNKQDYIRSLIRADVTKQQNG